MSTEYIQSRAKRSPFVNKNFVMLWIGGTISRLGQVLLLEGFGLWILFDVVKGPSAITFAQKGLAIAAFFALLTIGVFAGVFVDRWPDKRRILLIASAGRVLGCLLPIIGAFMLSFTPNPAPWMIALALVSMYLTVLIVSTFTHFAIPASYAIFAQCVEEQDYSYANGLLLTTTFLSILVGTFMAFELFYATGIYGVLVLSAALYGISYVAIAQIKVTVLPSFQKRRGMFREWWESIVFALKTPLFAMLLLALVLINTWNGALTMLSSNFIVQNLHMAFQQSPIYDTNDTFYGALGITIEIAFSVGALFFGIIARRMGEKRIFSYTFFAAGVLMIAVSRFTQYMPAAVAIFMISFLTTAINVIAVPIYLWVTPWHLLGRVRSIIDVTMNLAALVAGAICFALVGSAFGGFHAQVFGMTFTPIDTIFGAIGVICAIGAMVIAYRLTQMGKMAAPARALARPDSSSNEPESARKSDRASMR